MGLDCPTVPSAQNSSKERYNDPAALAESSCPHIIDNVWQTILDLIVGVVI
jgi:hypothetical protein